MTRSLRRHVIHSPPLRPTGRARRTRSKRRRTSSRCRRPSPRHHRCPHPRPCCSPTWPPPRRATPRPPAPSSTSPRPAPTGMAARWTAHPWRRARGGARHGVCELRAPRGGAPLAGRARAGLARRRRAAGACAPSSPSWWLGCGGWGGATRWSCRWCVCSLLSQLVARVRWRHFLQPSYGRVCTPTSPSRQAAAGSATYRACAPRATCTGAGVCRGAEGRVGLCRRFTTGPSTRWHPS